MEFPKGSICSDGVIWIGIDKEEIDGIKDEKYGTKSSEQRSCSQKGGTKSNQIHCCYYQTVAATKCHREDTSTTTADGGKTSNNKEQSAISDDGKMEIRSDGLQNAMNDEASISSRRSISAES